MTQKDIGTAAVHLSAAAFSVLSVDDFLKAYVSMATLFGPDLRLKSILQACLDSRGLAASTTWLVTGTHLTSSSGFQALTPRTTA